MKVVSCHRGDSSWFFGFPHMSRVPTRERDEKSWQRGGGRLSCRLEKLIRRSPDRQRSRALNRRAGWSGRGYCWPIEKTPRFLRSAGHSGCIIKRSSAAFERAVAEGPLAALDDRPRPGREPTITPEAKAWLVSLACRKAKELGYPYELWTTRLLARHAREHGPAGGHACLANLAQGTVCKILDQEEVKPHKVRYYLEQRDPDFAEKMAEVLCVYRQVRNLEAGRSRLEEEAERRDGDHFLRREARHTGHRNDRPRLAARARVHATFAREHEYKRHGTISLLAGIDLVTGKVHALVKDRHRSREFIEFLKLLDAAYPAHTAIKLILDIHSAHISKETKAWSAPINPRTALNSPSLPSTAPGSTSSRASSLNLPAPSSATSASRPNRNSRIGSWLPWTISNQEPVVHTWAYKLDKAAETNSNFENAGLAHRSPSPAVRPWRTALQRGALLALLRSRPCALYEHCATVSPRTA